MRTVTIQWLMTSALLIGSIDVCAAHADDDRYLPWLWVFFALLFVNCIVAGKRYLRERRLLLQIMLLVLVALISYGGVVGNCKTDKEV